MNCIMSVCHMGVILQGGPCRGVILGLDKFLLSFVEWFQAYANIAANFLSVWHLWGENQVY